MKKKEKNKRSFRMDKIRFLNARTRTTDSESHINNHIINYLNINGLIIFKKKSC